MSLKGLLLAGGKSSRMGQDKATLEFRGQSLWEHGVRCLRGVCDEVFLSLRSDSKLSAQSALDSQGQAYIDSRSAAKIPILYDAGIQMGPASALLAAYQKCPQSRWFILACDFPWIEPEALHFLSSHWRTPVTAYQHSDGTPEPLFSIWSPDALALLKRNVEQGRVSALHTLKECLGLDGEEQKNLSLKPSRTTGTELQACVAASIPDLSASSSSLHLLSPRNPRWLTNTNTLAQWQEALGE